MQKVLKFNVSLLKYSDYYSKTSESLFQYSKDEPILNDDGDVVDFAANNTSYCFKFKIKKVRHLKIVQKMLKQQYH